jgi:hypothetical protein
MISLFSRMMDWAVEQHFRKDASGRSVFLPLVCRGQGYFVDSKADEEKIRAFVKMYRSAAMLLVVVGTMGIYAWGWNPMFHAGANPLKNRLMALGGSSLVYLVIYLGAAWLLWGTYKGTVATLTSSLSEVGPGGIGQLSRVSQGTRRIALVCLFAGLVLVAVGVLAATRYKPALPRTEQPAAACPNTPGTEK